MGGYDLIAKRFYGDAEGEGDVIEPTPAREPFRLLIDDEARKAVLARAVTHQPTRGHRNPIKAVPVELDD